jgi:hypothetical protein
MMRSRAAGLRRVVRYGLLPALFYAGAFALLTYPWLRQFTTHFYADDVDGFQNAWNLWWVDKAITGLHQSPWYTTYLHHPDGMSLYAHTLTPFNGLVAIPLLRVLSLIETYNVLTAFGFVMAGVTAFWLAFSLTRSYAGSLLGGYAFTFSEYHFAHARLGQLNLVSLEWLPAFVLAFYCLVTRPGVGPAVAAALSLFALILCDYYYFIYAVIMAALLLIWTARTHRREPFRLDRAQALAWGWFIAISLATTSAVVAGFLLAIRRHAFVGAHDPNGYALDIAALFLPGSSSRFAGAGPHVWTRLLEPEQSAFIGYGPLAALIYVWLRRRDTPLPHLHFWYLLASVFAILALGPRLHVLHFELPFLRMPYAWLEALVPAIRLSGSPVRMIVMITLVGSIAVAEACRLCLETRRAGMAVLAAALAALVVVQSVPAMLPATHVQLPEAVMFLRDQPAGGGYFDATVEPLFDLQHSDLQPMAYQMYFQTVHQKPIAYGYTSRNTVAALEHDRTLQRLASADDFQTLHCGFNFRWLLSDRVIDRPGVRRTALPPRRSEDDSLSYLYALDPPCVTGAR